MDTKVTAKNSKLAVLLLSFMPEGTDVSSVNAAVMGCQINSLETAIQCIVTENSGERLQPLDLVRIYTALGLDNGQCTLDHVRNITDDEVGNDDSAMSDTNPSAESMAVAERLIIRSTGFMVTYKPAVTLAAALAVVAGNPQADITRMRVPMGYPDGPDGSVFLTVPTSSMSSEISQVTDDQGKALVELPDWVHTYAGNDERRTTQKSAAD